MGKEVLTLKSHNWRVYEEDDSTAVEAENTKGIVDYNEAIVIHLCLEEEGGGFVNNATYAAQYSFNQSDWFTPGVQGGTEVVNYDDNPNLTEHAIASSKIALCSPTAEKVHEVDCVDIDIIALTHNEVALCFQLNDTTGERTIYFRVVVAGTAVPLQTSATYPQVDSGVYEAPEGEDIPYNPRAIGRGIGRGIVR